jgi:hypothetical protein
VTPELALYVGGGIFAAVILFLVGLIVLALVGPRKG